MAKMKTKEGPIGTLATEVQPGCWEFTTGSYTWRWWGNAGLNLRVAHDHNDGSRDWEPVLYAKSLDHAIMFGCGFEAGAARLRPPICVGPSGAEVKDEQIKKSL